MKRNEKLNELTKELIYQMTGKKVEDTQNADYQIALTYLEKAMDYTHSYTTCKTILEDRLVKIKTEPDGIVRETMIDNLLIGLDDL